MALTNASDGRQEFLLQFADWLTVWGAGKNCLTQQTHALLHTTSTIATLVK